MGLPSILFIIIAVILVLTLSIITFLMARFPTVKSYQDTFMAGDDTFAYAEGDNWTVGFAKSVLTPDDWEEKTYYIAGYFSNNPVEGVLDDMYVRAMWIDDNTGRGGVAIVSVDCVGLSRRDIMDIRIRLSAFIAESNAKSINVVSTHTHAAVDTQGLWGEKFYKSGRDSEYIEKLKDKVAQAVIDAYAARIDGNLYAGKVETVDMQDDVRTPIAYDPNLYRLRFTPDGEGKDIYLINYAAHAELLGKRFHKISADWPAYMGKYIEENANAEFVYINGAIGGMISAAEIRDVYDTEGFDCLAYTMSYGADIGQYALSIVDEVELKPIINAKSSRIYVPVDNKLLTVARFLNVLNSDVVRRKGTIAKYELPSEITYIEIGDSDVKMFLVPGELYPELQLGGFLSSEESATGTEADYTILNDMVEDKGFTFVVGLANDQMGYIIPSNDYLLHDKLPYLNWAKDKFGREHYEETNSTGVKTARIILEGFEELIQSTK